MTWNPFKLRRENAALRADLERWKRLYAEPESLHVEYQRGQLMMNVRHHAIKVIAMSLAEALGPAANFITATMMCPATDEAFEVTVRRISGKTPAEVLDDLRSAMRQAANDLRAGRDPDVVASHLEADAAPKTRSEES